MTVAMLAGMGNAVPMTVTCADEEEWYVGDMNRNGKIELDDAQQVLQIALRITTGISTEDVFFGGGLPGPMSYVDLDDAQQTLNTALKIADKEVLPKSNIEMVGDYVCMDNDMILHCDDEIFDTKERAVTFAEELGIESLEEAVKDLDEKMFDDKYLIFVTAPVDTGKIEDIQVNYCINRYAGFYINITQKANLVDDVKEYRYFSFLLVDNFGKGSIDEFFKVYSEVLPLDYHYKVSKAYAYSDAGEFLSKEEVERYAVVRTEAEFDKFIAESKSKNHQKMLEQKKKSLDFTKYSYVIYDMENTLSQTITLQTQLKDKELLLDVVNISYSAGAGPVPDIAPAAGIMTVFVEMNKNLVEDKDISFNMKKEEQKDFFTLYNMAGQYIYQDKTETKNHLGNEAYAIKDENIKNQILGLLEESIGEKNAVYKGVKEDIEWIMEHEEGYVPVVINVNMEDSFVDGINIYENGFVRYDTIREDTSLPDENAVTMPAIGLLDTSYSSKTGLKFHQDFDELKLKLVAVKGCYPQDTRLEVVVLSDINLQDDKMYVSGEEVHGVINESNFICVVAVGSWQLESGNVELLYP